MSEEIKMKPYTCCFCGGTFTNWGNNPWPVDESEDARCCDGCNAFVVLPARLSRLRQNLEEV